jgi:hypothetical protein
VRRLQANPLIQVNAAARGCGFLAISNRLAGQRRVSPFGVKVGLA